MRILFLEDETQDCELMKYELGIAGIRSDSIQVSSKKDFFNELDNFRPDVILADYSLPAFNGMHAFRLFKEKNIFIPFILVTGTLTEQLASECLNEGVDNFILKSDFKRLPAIIMRSLKTKKAEKESQKIAEELERSNEELKQLREEANKAKSHEMLSSREFEILCLIASGNTIREIADILFLSPATVATYRARILEKMNLKSNVDTTRYAVLNKLVE